MSLITNLKKRGLRDILNPRKWGIFMRSKKKYERIAVEDLQYRSEMVVYRMSLCKSCVQEGSCLHCGCKSPELFYDPQNWCSGGNWDSIKCREDWEKFKNQMGIDFMITYNPTAK